MNEQSDNRSLNPQYIQIFKVGEDEKSAKYIFCADLWVPDENREGRNRLHQTNFGYIQICKSTGEVSILTPMPEDTGNCRALASAHILKRHWKEGCLPEATCYASG
jgi:hypothetical protein